MENTDIDINARLDKVLSDAGDIIDGTITAAIDETDPVRRTVVLTDGFRKVLETMLPHEDLEKLHFSDTIGILHGPCPSGNEHARVVPTTLPEGADGAMPGPDPDEEVTLPARRNPIQKIREEFGLELRRYATASRILHVGVRGEVADSDTRSLWKIEIDRGSGEAFVCEDDETVLSITANGSNMAEKCAVRALLTLLRERRRRNPRNRK